MSAANGRAQICSSISPGQNVGLEGMADQDERYALAEEYATLVKRLWDCWEPGAILHDRASGVLVDPAKVHTIDYAGKYDASRGPLISGPCPEGRPIIAQAGGSSTGRAFVAAMPTPSSRRSRGART